MMSLIHSSPPPYHPQILICENPTNPLRSTSNHFLIPSPWCTLSRLLFPESICGFACLHLILSALLPCMINCLCTSSAHVWVQMPSCGKGRHLPYLMSSADLNTAGCKTLATLNACLLSPFVKSCAMATVGTPSLYIPCFQVKNCQLITWKVISHV